MDITARIEDMIARKGMTKKLVAQRMGRFDQGFNKLITNPKWQTIEAVAEAIGISVQDLLFDKPEPAPEPANPLNDQTTKQPDDQTMPDLILIDRATGETRKYVLLPQEAHA